MTWHDRGAGNHNPESRLPPAFAYHSGTVLTVLSILRCRKYLPQCNANAIYAGRTYPVVKVIQQLLVTKTNVCAQHHAGCVAASINHLGMIPVEGLGRAVAATHDLNWVDELCRNPLQTCVFHCRCEDL
eukprot:228217-Amphidinium_carterae.1